MKSTKASKLTFFLFWGLITLNLLSPSIQMSINGPGPQRKSRLLLRDVAPSAVIITQAPGRGEIVNSSSTLIRFEVLSGLGVRLQCRLAHNGNPMKDWDTCSSPYTIRHDDDGRYTFQVKMDRGAGIMYDPGETISWFVDRSPPNTTIQVPFPDNCTRDVRFYFSGTDNETDIRYYECELDEQGWLPCISPHEISGITNGEHIFRVRAVDLAGNKDPEPAVYLWRTVIQLGNEQRLLRSEADSPSYDYASNRRVPLEVNSSDGESVDDEGDLMNRARSNLLIAVSIIVFGLISLFFLCLGMYKCYTHVKQSAADMLADGGGSHLTSLESDVLSGLIDMSGFSSLMAASWPEQLRRFRYKELWAATGGFPQKGILGEGGFGKVYSGTLEGGQPVAVKKLEQSGQQGDREFFVEVATLCRARHLNILRLLGVCIENQNRVCVFELMDWGSVRSLLNDGDSRFTWEARLKVATGAARGLACLHESVDPPIVHRDLKSENILMDHDGEARISDFGLCTLAHHEARQRQLRRNVTMTVGTIRGTFGYLAPEVIGSGRVSTKSDVYAFGVFLLELLTGRRPIETARPSQEQDLVKWVLRHIDKIDRILEAVDPLISSDVSFVQITAFVELAALCLHFSPSSRPSASEAAYRLEELMSFREHQSTSIKGKSKKGSKGKIDELCLAPRLSETSGTIPTGMPMCSCPSEGELTPHTVNTPIASTSSGRIPEIELPQRRYQDSSSEQSPHGIFSPTHREHGIDPGPSTTADTHSQNSI